jgi:endonuclease YncB( thermonuclease family)
MKTISLFLCLILTFISCNNQPQKKKTFDLQGRVVSVYDGDTFTLLTADKQQHKIRLHGIDCPERKQDFGNVARQKLSEIIFGQEVKVLQTDIDRYQRIVGIVYNSKGDCANEELLRAGLAWHYRQYDDNEEWARMEKEARAAKRGLWSQPNPLPPSQYRRPKQ